MTTQGYTSFRTSGTDIDDFQEHKKYSETDLFFKEMNYLQPYFGEGSGAFWVSFEKSSKPSS